LSFPQAQSKVVFPLLFSFYFRIAGNLTPVTGPGRIDQSFNFRAEQTNATAMLTTVLKNGTAAAAYA
jgi:hypothetical protein